MTGGKTPSTQIEHDFHTALTVPSLLARAICEKFARRGMASTSNLLFLLALLRDSNPCFSLERAASQTSAWGKLGASHGMAGGQRR